MCQLGCGTCFFVWFPRQRYRVRSQLMEELDLCATETLGRVACPLLQTLPTDVLFLLVEPHLTSFSSSPIRTLRCHQASCEYRLPRTLQWPPWALRSSTCSPAPLSWVPPGVLATSTQPVLVCTRVCMSLPSPSRQVMKAANGVLLPSLLS